MARPVQPPTIKPDPHKHGHLIEHPAFGMIGAHRVEGSANLNGSDFEHHRFIRVCVRRSRIRRDLARDWHHAEDEIVEVDLSEAQWATFVSAMNLGNGVPCTIARIGREHLPGLPPIDRKKQFGGEVDERIERAVSALTDLANAIDGAGLPKKIAASLRASVEKAIREFGQNVPFVAESFDKHMEEVVEAAKADVHAYILGEITRAGLSALRGSSPVALPGDAASEADVVSLSGPSNGEEG